MGEGHATEDGWRGGKLLGSKGRTELKGEYTRASLKLKGLVNLGPGAVPLGTPFGFPVPEFSIFQALSQYLAGVTNHSLDPVLLPSAAPEV